jgi:VanZ family protein
LLKYVWLPAIAWLAIITLLFLLPGSALPKANLHILFFDKWVHMLLFAILTWLFCRPFAAMPIGSAKYRIYFLLILVTTLYGIAIEFIQRDFITNRSFDVKDIYADAVGSLLGLLIAIFKPMVIKQQPSSVRANTRYTPLAGRWPL